uniref:SigB/SigF/SigG family RNA polymerase sigma factor n=1 Tax=Candidatus Fimenecus sp. TaxID=3022888 RepID=UPI004024BEDA
MLSHEETMRLLSLAADGDDNATERLIAENTPLLKSIVKRYMGKHIEYDDLFQIAGIGLLKAIKNFKQDFNVRFSTYAVPMILGEIKRQMRDDGYIKVSRSLKSLSSKITRYMDEVIKQGNDDPTVEQIARHFDISPSDVVFALDATRLPVSLYETTSDKDGKQTELVDRLPTDEDRKMVQSLILKDMLSRLSERERKIIIYRFFRDMTQGEIAEKMGVSQVQISRLETKILDKLKQMYSESD